MNKGMLTVGIIFISVLALILLTLLSNYSTGSELDYYLLKETVDAAMVDAIDEAYLRNCGLYRIDKEKFAESFLYRFANSVETTRGYKVYIYDINEMPPKVSVRVDSTTALQYKNEANNKEAIGNISTSYDAILETTYSDDFTVAAGLNSNSEMCKGF